MQLREKACAVYTSQLLKQALVGVASSVSPSRSPRKCARTYIVLFLAISSFSCTYSSARSSINVITLLALYFAIPLTIAWLGDLTATTASILHRFEDHTREDKAKNVCMLNPRTVRSGPIVFTLEIRTVLDRSGPPREVVPFCVERNG